VITFYTYPQHTPGREVHALADLCIGQHRILLKNCQNRTIKRVKLIHCFQFFICTTIERSYRNINTQSALLMHYHCDMFNDQAVSEFQMNPRALKAAVPDALAAWLGRDALDEVRSFLNICPRHQVTPLVRLDAMADALGLGAIYAKDEGQRLGLGSFKALGGAYAVATLVMEWASTRLQRTVMPAELMSDAVKDAVSGRIICCATDGNHGLSVAAGARLFGCKAVIFVHHHVAEERRDRLRALGAEVIEVPGTYDDSVDACSTTAIGNGWHVVSDTSWRSDGHIPARVMQGYTVLVDEALAQIDTPPSHIFVQGGVGGLAAAVAGHCAAILGSSRPQVIVVEPERASCLMQSVRAGKPVEAAAGTSTVMAMLECYRPSDTAWPILDNYADTFMTLPDEAASIITHRLANPAGADPVIKSGPSGGVGLAGLVAAMHDHDLRDRLALSDQSRVLTIITEGSMPDFSSATSSRSASK
jgi:diaminopropionate ammonia-lyase